MDLEDVIKKLQKECSALDEVIASLAAMRSSLMVFRFSWKWRRRSPVKVKENA
jgi:hypothetical protein